MNDPYNLQRFIAAQTSTYLTAQNELSAGRKKSHWMWFIFPQIKGLGSSETAKFYSIQSLDEAGAYLRHDILGPRLVTCTSLVNQIADKTAHEILGSPDDLKFRSCMTLFTCADPLNNVFPLAIDKFFGGEQDPLTLKIISDS